jgi:hypothetical protein
LCNWANFARSDIYNTFQGKVAMAFDVIGDIHGQADKLHGLLQTMGYRDTNGAYRHPNRTAIFVGDFIDRGPKQVESVMTVRRMVEASSAMAVMGNHEFNAIAWHTNSGQENGDYLRTHRGDLGGKNRSQHLAFLAEVEHRPSFHKEIIDWFLTLPLWLDLDGIRIVHACWHDGYMEALKPHLSADRRLDRNLMSRASTAGTMEFRTVEGLTKGLEVELPDGHSFKDKDGHVRRNVRIRWWDKSSDTYRGLALMPDAFRARLPDLKIANDIRAEYEGTKPVFFGHYWMTGEPMLQSDMAACVDYSAAKEGPLVAYQWDGEPQLAVQNFVRFG